MYIVSKIFCDVISSILARYLSLDICVKFLISLLLNYICTNYGTDTQAPGDTIINKYEKYHPWQPD